MNKILLQISLSVIRKVAGGSALVAANTIRAVKRKSFEGGVSFENR